MPNLSDGFAFGRNMTGCMDYTDASFVNENADDVVAGGEAGRNEMMRVVNILPSHELKRCVVRYVASFQKYI